MPPPPRRLRLSGPNR